MKTRLCIVLYLIGSGLAVASDTAPVEIHLTENPASYVTLGKLVVVMERTTLKALTTTVGSGVIFTNGLHAHDGGGDEVCFLYGNAEVHFVSNGEFGGANRQITDFRLEAASKPDARCAKLPEPLQPVRVLGRLTLGDSRDAVERRFGSALGKSDARVSYRFAGKSPGSCADDGFDVGASLEVSYTSNKTTRLTGWQITSC